MAVGTEADSAAVEPHEGAIAAEAEAAPEAIAPPEAEWLEDDEPAPTKRGSTDEAEDGDDASVKSADVIPLRASEDDQ